MVLAFSRSVWYNTFDERSVTMAEERKTKNSEARLRANRKYQDKFQQVKFYCEPELYLEIKDYCEARGESVAAFIKRLARAEMERHPLPENSAK